MYYDGRTPAASVRSNLQFFLGANPLEELKALEPTMRKMLTYYPKSVALEMAV